MQYSIKALKEKFGDVPPRVESAFLSVDPDEKLKEVAEEYNLHIDQGGDLQDEVLNIISGETKPKDFKKNIRKHLSVSKEEAEEITRDIDEMIFSPMKEELKKDLQETADEEEEEELDRDKLISEIEDPPPAKPRTKQDKSTTQRKTQKEESIEKLQGKTEESEKTQPPQKEEGAEQTHSNKAEKDIFEQKIKNETVTQSANGNEGEENEPEKEEANNKNKEKTDEKTQTQYEKDPYREPIE